MSASASHPSTARAYRPELFTFASVGHNAVPESPAQTALRHHPAPGIPAAPNLASRAISTPTHPPAPARTLAEPSHLLFATQYAPTDAGYRDFCRLVADLLDSPAPAPPTAAPAPPNPLTAFTARSDHPAGPAPPRLPRATRPTPTPPGKPAESYAHIIYRALESSPSGKLTLADIYAWIEETYPFYRTADPVWKNSIRHNLSLNSAFMKVPRPESSKGKGGYWAIDYTSQRGRRMVRGKGSGR